MHLEIVLSSCAVGSANVRSPPIAPPRLLTDVPVSDIELTRDELQDTPALTLDDALRQVPGFSLYRRFSSRVANPTTQGVSLRGLGANGSSRALVLQDGIPLNDPFGGWVYWDRVPAESVSSVEIAQEGALQPLRQRSAGRRGPVYFPPRGSRRNFAGDFLRKSKHSEIFRSGPAAKKADGRPLSPAKYFNTDGYILDPASRPGPVDTRAGSDHGTADLMIGRKIGQDSLIFARGWYLDETRSNGTPLQTNDTKLGQGALGANLQSWALTARLTLRFYADIQTYHQGFSSVTSVVTTRDTETQTDLQTVPAQGVGGSAVWSKQIGKRQTVVAGFDEHEEIGASHDIQFTAGMPFCESDPPEGAAHRGVFGEDLIQITSALAAFAQRRVDHWSNFDASTMRIPLAAGMPLRRRIRRPLAERLQPARHSAPPDQFQYFLGRFRVSRLPRALAERTVSLVPPGKHAHQFQRGAYCRASHGGRDRRLRKHFDQQPPGISRNIFLQPDRGSRGQRHLHRLATPIRFARRRYPTPLFACATIWDAPPPRDLNSAPPRTSPAISNCPWLPVRRFESEQLPGQPRAGRLCGSPRFRTTLLPFRRVTRIPHRHGFG